MLGCLAAEGLNKLDRTYESEKKKVMIKLDFLIENVIKKQGRKSFTPV
jgi:hypothetical protein